MLEEKKKGSFTRLAFHLLSDASLAGPAAGFLMLVLHVRTSRGPSPLDLQSRAEGRREWDSGRQREGEPPWPRTCAPHVYAHPLAAPGPLELALESGGSQRPVEASVRLEKAGARKPHSCLPGRSEPAGGGGGGTCPGPPPPHLLLSLPDTPRKARAPVFCATPAVTLMTRL